MARPRTPLLNRQRIIEVAVEVIDAEGLDAVSTRRLAAELGVRAPSLYNHFANKDDIYDAIADHVIEGVDLSMFGAHHWAEALRLWGRSYRAALVAHPNVIPLLSRGPGRRPGGLRIADAVYGGLVAAGWPRSHATRIGALMRYYLAGSALGSFAGGFVPDAELYADRYPHLNQAHLLAGHQHDIDQGAFELGLDALIDGLTRLGDTVIRPEVPNPAAG